jgi:Ni,Fe-hydrogenase III small subunit
VDKKLAAETRDHVLRMPAVPEHSRTSVSDVRTTEIERRFVVAVGSCGPTAGRFTARRNRIFSLSWSNVVHGRTDNLIADNRSLITDH